MNDLLITEDALGEVIVEKIVRERLGSFQSRIYAELFADALRKAGEAPAESTAATPIPADAPSACKLAAIVADCAARPAAPAPEVVEPYTSVPAERADAEAARVVETPQADAAAPKVPGMTRAELFGSVAQAIQPEPVADGHLTHPSLADEVYDLALERIDQGEKIGAVADDLRIPLHVLKSKWSRYKADKKADAAAAADVTATGTEPAPEEWAQAFNAMDDGGDLKKIAAALGVDPFKVRGKYAARKGAQKRAAIKAQDVDAEPLNLESCSLCQRQFKPSASSPDKCSRCARD